MNWQGHTLKSHSHGQEAGPAKVGSDLRHNCIVAMATSWGEGGFRGKFRGVAGCQSAPLLQARPDNASRITVALLTPRIVCLCVSCVYARASPVSANARLYIAVRTPITMGATMDRWGGEGRRDFLTSTRPGQSAGSRSVVGSLARRWRYRSISASGGAGAKKKKQVP